MKIEIGNGTYTRDEEAMSLLTASEEEYIAALSQKLAVRLERRRQQEERAAKKRKEKELEAERKRKEKEEREKRMRDKLFGF